MTKPVTWDQLIGLDKVRRIIEASCVLPFKLPQMFTGQRLPIQTLLLYGPPGTGKTQVARAMATELDWNFYTGATADLVSKYMGDSEKAVKMLFDTAREQAKPSIIFFDEFDALCINRDTGGGGGDDGTQTANKRILSEILQQMDGIKSINDKLFIIAATNMPQNLDTAILRRFAKKIYIGLPSHQARRAMFERGLAKNEHTLTDTELDELAHRTKGYSGADIAMVVRDALHQPVMHLAGAQRWVVRPSTGAIMPYVPHKHDTDLTLGRLTHFPHEATWHDLPEDTLTRLDLAYLAIGMADLVTCLKRIKPSTDAQKLAGYSEWTALHGEHGHDDDDDDDHEEEKKKGNALV